MTEPKVGLNHECYLLNTDAGIASNGPRRSADPLDRAVIAALLRTRRLVTVDQITKAIGPATHNVAEYRGLIEGLKLARNYGVRRIRVYMDSELVVDQVNGFSAVRQEHLIELHEEASSLFDLFESFRISWVPREMNAEADRLVRDALGLFGDDPERLQAAADHLETAEQRLRWQELAPAEKAEYLLAHPTISDRSWTDKPRRQGEKREAFIRRVLLGGPIFEGPDDPALGGVREPRRPTPPTRHGSIALRWQELAPAEKAEYLLAHPTISDRSWTDKPRRQGEKREAFIRRVLLEPRRPAPPARHDSSALPPPLDSD
jgi:ribonuclease HI